MSLFYNTPVLKKSGDFTLKSGPPALVENSGFSSLLWIHGQLGMTSRWPQVVKTESFELDFQL